MFSRARAQLFILCSATAAAASFLLLRGLGLLYVHEVLPLSSEAARFLKTMFAFGFSVQLHYPGRMRVSETKKPSGSAFSSQVMRIGDATATVLTTG